MDLIPQEARDAMRSWHEAGEQAKVFLAGLNELLAWAKAKRDNVEEALRILGKPE
jgi:hypothetical protein